MAQKTASAITLRKPAHALEALVYHWFGAASALVDDLEVSWICAEVATLAVAGAINSTGIFASVGLSANKCTVETLAGVAPGRIGESG